MQTKLPAIENPSGIVMRLAYWFTKKQFGKVLSPLKVVYSRLPLRFILYTQKLSKLEKSFVLPQYLALLVRTHVGQLNTCHFCIDFAKTVAIKDFRGSEEKFLSVSSYKTSPLFSAKERAALLFAEELTLHKNISDKTFREAQNHFSERELVEIAWAVTAEHHYNIMNLAFGIESDGLCQLPAQNSH